MLRELIYTILNNYLSNYVEDLKVDQLSIALLQGEVELENLPLRKDALTRLGCPITIKTGIIGKIRLKIPVRQIRTAPWVIQMKNLYLVTGPCLPEDLDIVEEESLRLEQKLHRLDLFEAHWREKNNSDASEIYSSTYTTFSNFTNGLLSNIVENLQLEISEFHIRYEDDICVNNSTIAAGIILDQLTVKTCDSNWTPGFIPLNSAFSPVYKLVEIKGLAMYWDTNYQPSNHVNLDDFSTYMASSKSSKHCYILCPVAVEAQLKRNRTQDPLKSRKQPRFSVNLSLEAMNVNLNELQYIQMLKWSRGFEQLLNQREAKLSKHTSPNHSDIYKMWRWSAYRSLTLKRVSEIYQEIYVEYLGLGTITPEVKQLKEIIELRYGYEALREMREKALEKVAILSDDVVTASVSSSLSQWIWDWYTSEKPQEESKIVDPREERLESEILQALKETELYEEESVYNRDLVLFSLTLSLKQGSMKLFTCDEVPSNLVEIGVENLCFDVELRPKLNSKLFSIKVGNVYLKDCLTKNSLYPMVIESQQQQRDNWHCKTAVNRKSEYLLVLQFEIKPLGSKVDYKLHVDSRSLCIVYNPRIIQAINDFFQQENQWRKRYERMKRKTVEKWESLLENFNELPATSRAIWELHLNISAPQILFVDSFYDNNSHVLMVDFGKLLIKNTENDINIIIQDVSLDESGDSFHTPFSSPQNESANPEFIVNVTQDVTEAALYKKLYESFNIELTDLQILVGKSRDILKYAQSRATSTAHVVDRFNISIVLEKRIIPCCDKDLPNLKFSATLPKLNLHINEMKVVTIRNMIRNIVKEATFFGSSNMTVNSSGGKGVHVPENCLLALRFCIDDLTMEVQSRGRPVAELQVRGVRFLVFHKQFETNCGISVYSLLLVDAIQTYGNDYDLLVASHQKVAIDSLSGSLKDSNSPTPTSPASPDYTRMTQSSTPSGLILQQALLKGLNLHPYSPSFESTEPPDGSLISAEIFFIRNRNKNSTDIISTIHCNTLDLIANQESVVELCGFIQRLFPNPSVNSNPLTTSTSLASSIDSLNTENTSKVEIIFEFQRLNLLLLRGVFKKEMNKTIARKIATATLTETKVQVTISDVFTVAGSLGGVQVLDLTPEGRKHQRILSSGHDPLIHNQHLLNVSSDIFSGTKEEHISTNEAFSFTVVRSSTDVDLKIRMASVWYTHSPVFINELHSCATEFKQYVKSFARSIRSAAKEMAIGLVHARSEILYDPNKTASRMSLIELSPSRRRNKSTISLDYIENFDNEEEDELLLVKLDIIFESPVVVLPRSMESDDVFVAHLGRIKLFNTNTTTNNDTTTSYQLEIRDMSLASLNISGRFIQSEVKRAEYLYSCNSDAIQVLHDTLISFKFKLERHTFHAQTLFTENSRNTKDLVFYENKTRLQIEGQVVEPLQVSLRRSQYEQLIDTIKLITSSQSATVLQSPITNTPLVSMQKSIDKSIVIGLKFTIPELRVTLCGNFNGIEQEKVEVIFQQFLTHFDMHTNNFSHLKLSLRSLVLEDLSQAKGSPHRKLVVSRMLENTPRSLSSALSESDLTAVNEPLPTLQKVYCPYRINIHRSLPDLINESTSHEPTRTKYFEQEQISPENLVYIDLLTIEPKCQIFPVFGGKRKIMNVIFNALDIVINIESWVMILDFFGITEEQTEINTESDEKVHVKPNFSPATVIDIKVSSITVTLTRASTGELARASLHGLNSVAEICDGNTKINGQVNSISIVDVSTNGNLYQHKLWTQDQIYFTIALISDLKKNDKNFDVKVSFRFKKLNYVHSQRFIEELRTQLTNFNFLQTLVSKLRSVASGQLEMEGHHRSRRIVWDIEVEKPMLWLPISDKSQNFLAASVNSLSILNTFKVRACTKCKTCYSEKMCVSLDNVNVHSGIRTLGNQKSSEIDWSKSFVKDPFNLEVLIMRTPPNCAEHSMPDLSAQCTLSTIHAILDLNSYKLIRGFLAYNLGENLDDLEDLLPPPSNVVYSQSELDFVWITNKLNINLHNVIVDLIDNEHLAQINFINCSFTIENRSDGSRDMDLLSKEILVNDTRTDNCPRNLHKNILQSMKSFNPCDMQVEIHHRRLHDINKITIVFNKMRVMLILDWWLLAQKFISSHFDIDWDFETNSIISNNSTKEPNNEKFQLKLNISESEIVFVEDYDIFESNAIILKSTTVINFSPNIIDHPLSCNLNRCEVFYCILNNEDESELSIIDPTNINIEVFQHEHDKCRYDITMQSISLRLSYHDMCLLQKMFSNLPKQLETVVSKENTIDELSDIKSINKLRSLGFTENDCTVAFYKCNSDLNEAAIWLTQNALHSSNANVYDGTGKLNKNNKPFLNIDSLNIRVDLILLCIIDDCQDSDVPLLEFTLSKSDLHQDLYTFERGSLKSTISIAYYNRLLSGWEPLVENFQCKFDWYYNSLPRKIKFVINSIDTPLNVNITDSLLQLFKCVKSTWSNDDDDQHQQSKRSKRSTFIPFALHNETGCNVKFATHISSLSDLLHRNNIQQDINNWIELTHGETKPFTFEHHRHKLRHKNTHDVNRVNQVSVKIDGWEIIEPISIDKVGVYFRLAKPESTEICMPPARVVFHVSCEGSARKLITIRSALQIQNSLPYTVELKLDNSEFNHGGDMKYVTIKNKETYSVPLRYVHAMLRVKPLTEDGREFLVSKPITWSEVYNPGEVKAQLYCCRPANEHNEINGYRFIVAVRRELFPSEKQYPDWRDHPALTYMYPTPAHTLTLTSPIIIHNLLPNELECNIDNREIRIPPGKIMDLNFVDVTKEQILRLVIENFQSSAQVELLPFMSASRSVYASLTLTDSQARILQITARIKQLHGRGCVVSVSAPYWILNRTGLPLVFKQHGSSLEAAGQGPEHECARMLNPLVMSQCDIDNGFVLQIRLGQNLHKGSRVDFCKPFLPLREVLVRQLKATTSCDEVSYQIGITSKPGRGSYCRTTMIHLMPRFILYNKTDFELVCAQSCLATTFNDPAAQATYIRLVPGCSLPFHWRRLDSDLLMRVMLVDKETNWSGAFPISKNDLFHLNIRDKIGNMHFILVEMIGKDASFIITFKNACYLPPPIKVDNFSEVTVTVYQADLTSSHQCLIRPHCSVPYVWDEPTRSPKMVCIAPGGNEIIIDFSNFELAGELTYENFIYIAMAWTFPSSNNALFDEIRGQELVLAVPDKSTNVVLQRKEAGCRAQLWRMTASGQLQHEGSNPPNKNLNIKNAMVLDIDDKAPQPNHYARLIVRRLDPRRQSTQTWRFTPDGRLCCVHSNMCVQAKDGFFGLYKGNEIVLGPTQVVSQKLTETNIPAEQAITKQKLRPGSGILALNLTNDGPIRTLEISDKCISKSYIMLTPKDWCHFSPDITETVVKASQGAKLEPEEVYTTGFELRIRLMPGIGISLVDTSIREELAYCTLEGVSALLAVERNGTRRLDASILDIQVDNQMREAECPVVLYSPNSHSWEPSLGDTIHELLESVIEISVELIKSPRHDVDTINRFWILIQGLRVTIEEEQLLRLISFFGLCEPEAEPDSTTIAAGAEDYEMSVYSPATHIDNNLPRYFIVSILIKPAQIKLSAIKSQNLSPTLVQTGKRLGLRLIQFEDASIDLDPLDCGYLLLSLNHVLELIQKHFQQAFKRQSPYIIFSADMLGGAAGFVSNVSEGVRDLLNEPGIYSFGDLIINLTHGISTSAAKVTGSISDGIGLLKLDEAHEALRQRMRRRNESSTSFDHIKVGAKSFAYGWFGGVTSLFQHTYESFSADGVSGIIPGLGKGIVGTVTKPVMGTLDFATGLASALKDNTKSSKHTTPKQKRPSRCVVDARGLLPFFSEKQSIGQRFLRQINRNSFTEFFMAYEHLRGGGEELRLIVSSEAVCVFSCAPGHSFNHESIKDEFIKVHLGDLIKCEHIIERYHVDSTPRHYIVLHALFKHNGKYELRKPQVRCDTSEMAQWVCLQINYAKVMYEERIRTLVQLPSLEEK